MNRLSILIIRYLPQRTISLFEFGEIKAIKSSRVDRVAVTRRFTYRIENRF